MKWNRIIGGEKVIEKQVILNGNSSAILEHIKKRLILENYEQSTTFGFEVEYGTGYLTVFEKIFYRNESITSLTLHIYPLENEQVRLTTIISGISAGIIKVDWLWVGKSMEKTLDKIIEEFK